MALLLLQSKAIAMPDKGKEGKRPCMENYEPWRTKV